MLILSALLLRGVAVGAFLVTALSVSRSDLALGTRLITVLMCLSAAAWTLTGSEEASMPFGRPYPILLLAFPAAGFFWAFVICVFQDRSLRWPIYLPAGLLFCLGVAMLIAPSGISRALLAAFNITAATLCLHAMVLIIRSWRGDLVDSRRSSRILFLGVAALLATMQGAAGGLHGLGLDGTWVTFILGETFGAVTLSTLALAMGGLFLQARSAMFLEPATPNVAPDPRPVAADQILLGKLEAFMDAGGWRQEGLEIGKLARTLGVQEHRLRRLINTQLQHRNFADFVNGYRIKAAQLRLADPSEADAGIASLAFDLGFGSLSPFNRAFRAATGATPTAWRRAALEAHLDRRTD